VTGLRKVFQCDEKQSAGHHVPKIIDDLVSGLPFQRVREPVQIRGHLSELMLDRARDDLFLAGEVVRERATGNAGDSSDIRGRDTEVPPVEQQGDRGVKKTMPRFRRSFLLSSPHRLSHHSSLQQTYRPVCFLSVSGR
jgi:hypothetical protein